MQTSSFLPRKMYHVRFKVAIIVFNYVQGEKGEKGERGEQGERGPSLHPPELKQSSLTITANKSDTKVLACQFLGNPIPSVTWKLPAKHKEISEVVDRENSLITSEVKVTNITWEDRGAVHCYASSLLGKDEGSGVLTVHSKLCLQVK